MYGLFRKSYDYYEWKDLIAVSESELKLQEFHKKAGYINPLLEGDDLPNRDDELNHFVIEEILVV